MSCEASGRVLNPQWRIERKGSLARAESLSSQAHVTQNQSLPAGGRGR